MPTPTQVKVIGGAIIAIAIGIVVVNWAVNLVGSGEDDEIRHQPPRGR